MRHSIILVLAVSFLGACVPNRKVTFLQKSDLNANNVPKDSMVRTYQLDSAFYKIQSNDLLSVRFESLTAQKFDFLSQQVQGNSMNQLSNALLIGELVDANGEIPFPVIGRVKVAGFSVFEIQNKLQALANQYLESPVVKVRLLNFRFTILGEVTQEGTVTLNNNRVSMLEAIGIAGGFGDLADRANVKLIRQVNNKSYVYYVNLLSEDFVNSPLYYIHQNDVLIVPPLKQRPFRKYAGQNLSLLVSTLSLLLLAINLSQ
jgi:polysaccharide export outer membrane protein